MIWFGKNRKSPTKTDIVSDTKIRQFISDAENAEKLVIEYGGVLEISAGLSFGAPKSLLPKSNEAIKTAIITYLLYLHTTKKLDRKTFEVLKVGYAELATFLDDDDAKLAVAATAAFNSSDPARIASSDVKQAIKRFERSNKESENLAAEFDAIVEKFGIGFD